MQIDRTRRAVAVGVGGASASSTPAPVMRAAYREGLGCIAMAPHQTFDHIDSLPVLRMRAPSGDPATIPWPDGDLLPDAPFPADVRRPALDEAWGWALDRTAHGGTPNQVTLSLLVVHRGRLLHERYAPDVTMATRTRTWSTAKSIAATLVGIAVGQGLLQLDAPLPIEWAPDELAEVGARIRGRSPMLGTVAWPPAGYERAADPRRRITLRHVLNMSSGLYPVDNQFNDIHGSGLTYFAGWSSSLNARDRGLVREPGTVWDYENNETLLAMLALRTALKDRQAYLEFPRRALLDHIGMRSTVPGVDRFGDYVMSSQVYTNARDLARLGLLYLNRGTWKGERILPESWVDFVRTPAPSTRRFGNFYGGQFWLVPDSRTDLPQDAYTTAGAQGQFAIVVPSRDLVVVRRGLDGPGPGFPVWDLLKQVLEAFPEALGGSKPVAADTRR
jgi:CubicO group peptidase (beta-lactamase class C family)